MECLIAGCTQFCNNPPHFDAHINSPTHNQMPVGIREAYSTDFARLHQEMYMNFEPPRPVMRLIIDIPDMMGNVDEDVIEVQLFLSGVGQLCASAQRFRDICNGIFDPVTGEVRSYTEAAFIRKGWHSYIETGPLDGLGIGNGGNSNYDRPLTPEVGLVSFNANDSSVRIWITPPPPTYHIIGRILRGNPRVRMLSEAIENTAIVPRFLIHQCGDRII